MTERVSGLSITRATPRDVPLILRLIKALADYEKLADRVVATEASLSDALFGPRPAVEAALASVDGQPAGYALWFGTFSTFLGQRGLYLEDLFVLPEWRGKGIGRALLAHVAEVAVSSGCGRVEWAVLDWNAPAIRFYRSLGAAPLDEWNVFRLDGEPLQALGEMKNGGS